MGDNRIDRLKAAVKAKDGRAARKVMEEIAETNPRLAQDELARLNATGVLRAGGETE